MPNLSAQAIPSKKGYTKPTMKKVAASCGENLARSAMPPETMAGMAAAKVSRKKNLTSS
jgi:hypothetical protein